MNFEEQLIGQLVAYDSSLDQTAPGVFKTIFQAGRQGDFLRALRTFEEETRSEIERACHLHYAQFVRSLDELLALRVAARSVRASVLAVKGDLARCGQMLYDAKVEVNEAQKMLCNTARTITAMTDCLAALNAAQQATLHIADANFGTGLRLLASLNSNLLPKVEHFPFMRPLLGGWLPAQVEGVRTFALEELKRWLEAVREAAPAIGVEAFARAQRRIEQWRTVQADLDGGSSGDAPRPNMSGAATSSASLLAAVSADHAAATFIDLIEGEREDAASILALFAVDFTPLLRAGHLFAEMGARETFEETFAQSRRAQCKVILSATVRFRDDHEGRSLATLLQSIAGFFVVDYFVVSKPQKFYTCAHAEGLWDEAVGTVNKVILDALNGCAGGGATFDQSLFMKIKWLLVFFLHSIEIYGLYSTTSMLDTILSLFYRYVEVKKAECHQRLVESAAMCSFAPLSMTKSHISSRIRRQMAFLLDGSGAPDLPPASPSTSPALAGASSGESVGTFPFSQVVVDIYGGLSDFILNFYVFLEGVPQQSSELDDIVKRGVEYLLDEATSAYASRLMGASVDVTLQIVRDLSCLVRMCDQIAALLNKKRSRSRTKAIVMDATERLVRCSQEGEARLLALLNDHIEGLFRANSYAAQALLFSAATAATEARPTRLFDTFCAFFVATKDRLEAALPPPMVRSFACNAFGHISTRITEDIYDDRTLPTLPMGLIEAVGADIGALAGLWRECMRDADAMIMESFSSVRQLVSLLTCRDVNEYLDPIVRNRKYSSLKAAQLLAVVRRVECEPTRKAALANFALLLM